MLLELLTASAT